MSDSGRHQAFPDAAQPVKNGEIPIYSRSLAVNRNPAHDDFALHDFASNQVWRACRSAVPGGPIVTGK